VKMRETGVYGA